ncbi:PREDICTED: alveolar macrophage chemotactic factor-like [Crocodylus porosus]|uniref:alveolar macrophage chemotactic factor-like n=1 Tax=Crocodylus porosus TaxID=8502 RepID=UPI00093E822D|nr:PREDICTED: alveolar macrophage chemotactic factor-like [Crocodylus porosus]
MSFRFVNTMSLTQKRKKDLTEGMACKLIVILAFITLTASYRINMKGARCLCLQTTDKIVFGHKQIKTIEIFPESTSCENVEIIVSLKTGRQICLDPKATQIKTIFQQLIRKKGKKNNKPSI